MLTLVRQRCLIANRIIAQEKRCEVRSFSCTNRCPTLATPLSAPVIWNRGFAWPAPFFDHGVLECFAAPDVGVIRHYYLKFGVQLGDRRKNQFEHSPNFLA